MTEQRLKQAYYIRREIKEHERRLREIRLATITGSRNDGMPKAGGSDKISATAVKIVMLEEKINALRLQLIEAEADIMDFIADVDDSFIRQVIYYRHIMCFSWSKTAYKVGGGNTADSCRMAYKRFMRRGAENDGTNTKGV